MGEGIVEVADAKIHFFGVFRRAERFVFFAYLLRHPSLAKERTQILVVRFNPGADAAGDSLVVFWGITHSAGAEQSDLLAA